MLYKKYHRSYVRQFKNGTKIKLKSDEFEGKILAEPSIDEWQNIFILIEFISDNRFLYWKEITLVYVNGRLRKNKDDVIQEIS